MLPSNPSIPTHYSFPCYYSAVGQTKKEFKVENKIKQKKLRSGVLYLAGGGVQLESIITRFFSFYIFPQQLLPPLQPRILSHDKV